jgi:signal transduction histidine kinase
VLKLARAELRDPSASFEGEGSEQHLSLSLAAHEVRRPIATVRALLDAFIVQAEQASGDLALLHRSREELGRVSDLMNALLSWGSGPPPLMIESVDLVALAQGIAASTEGAWGEGRVNVVGPERLVVRADPLHLGLAIGNLVQNALAYSPPGLPVSIRIQRRPDVGWVGVADRGPGIPFDERRVIFDPFARGVVGQRTRRGNGLGLFLVKQVVEAHEGRVTVETGTAGTTFGIELPVGRAQAGRLRTRADLPESERSEPVPLPVSRQVGEPCAS